MGTVNIFLGGSGKYIAEELKGTSLYYDIHMPDSLTFDLDTSATHTGTFALDTGSELITVAPGFAGFAQDQVAVEWAALDAGRGLNPLDNKAGPQLRPETSVMRLIGKNVHTLPAPRNGLWGVRGPGLLAFATFFDPRGPGNAAGLRQNFQERIGAALRRAQAQGGPVWVNIITSTAGGTGAGTFLPLALWLHSFAKSEVRLESINIALVMFWWTTFANEDVVERERTELLSKGRSGSFAILRELQLLNFGGAGLREPTRHPERFFPFGRGAADSAPLTYRLDGKPFAAIYWIGMRPDELEATKTDVYDEGSRLVQLLSNTVVRDDITRATGDYTQRQVVSIVSVDYPRMREAQRLSGELVERAIDKLLGDPDNDPAGTDALKDQGGLQPNALEMFLGAEWDNALSRVRLGQAPAKPENLDNLVKNVQVDQPITLVVSRNTQRRSSGYAILEETEWQEYCISLKRDLDQQRVTRRQRTRQASARLMADSVNHFRAWTSDEVLAPKLNPSGEDQSVSSLVTVEKTLAGVDQDLLSVRNFFSAPRGISDRVPDSSDWQYRPVQEIDAEIGRQYDRLLNPPGADDPGGLNTARWLMVLAMLVGITAVAWYLLEPFLTNLGRPLAALGIGIAFAAGLFFMLRKPKLLEERRREEEDRQFKLYIALSFREAADALFEAVKETYVPETAKHMGVVKVQIENLLKVYAELQGRASARRARADKMPRHSVDQVGRKIALPLEQRDPSIAKLAESVRVAPQLGADHMELVLMIRGIPPVRNCSGQISSLKAFVSRQDGGAIGEVPGQREFNLIDKTLDDNGTTALRDVLPKDFNAAMEADGRTTKPAKEERMGQLLRKLMHLDERGSLLPGPDPRRPSLSGVRAGRALRLLLVPDDAVEALVNQALDIRDPGTSQSLRDNDEFQIGLRQIKEIGPSIVALTIRQADNLFLFQDTPEVVMLPEVREAQQAYYHTDRQAQHDRFFLSQRIWNFHILPELAAAAAIEMSSSRISPLHPLVVSRLLGSDPDSGGPTLLELFYLLRHYGFLGFDLEGEGATRRRVFRLRLPGFDPVRLYSEQVIQPSDSDDPFVGDGARGEGRRVVNGFDAFADFMLYSGDYMPNPAGQDSRFVGLPGAGAPGAARDGVALHVAEWNDLGERVLGRMQGAVIDFWYRPDNPDTIEAERSAVAAIGADDASAMPTTIGEDWKRAVEVIAEAGARKRIGLFPDRR